jgi:hypothetical protein
LNISTIRCTALMLTDASTARATSLSRMSLGRVKTGRRVEGSMDDTRLMRRDQVMLGTHRALHVVTDDA